jgi:hypothetical protein
MIVSRWMCRRGPLRRVRLIAARLVLACLLAAGLAAPGAHAQVRVMTYNIAQMQGNQTALEDVIAAAHADDKFGFAVPVAVFVFQEVRDEDRPALEVAVANATPLDEYYFLGTYTNDGESTYGGAQAMFYRAGFVDEIESAHVDIYTQAGRYTDRWKFQLVGYDSPEATFYVYSSHLKAGDTPDDRDKRLLGVQDIRANADALGDGVHIIYAGDMNFSGSSEPAYQQFRTTGTGKAFDPLGTGTWSGPSYAIKHTQSPRSVSSGGLIGFGLDDRFDFLLLSDGEFNDDNGLSLMTGTYRAFGNDGQHYDEAINDGDNYYYPGDVARSNALADDLHDATDHLPVTIDCQIPAVMLAGMTDFGRVIQNAVYSAPFFVFNQADVVVPDAGDVLEYESAGSGVFYGGTSGSVPADIFPVADAIPVDTSTVGEVTGTLTVTSDGEGVQNPQFILNALGTILRPSNASFDGAADLDALTIEQTHEADTGVQTIEVNVHNLGFDALQALLDVDGVSPPDPPFAFDGGLESGVGADPATLSFSFDTMGLADGDYVANITIDVSDEDLPGEGTAVLDLTLDMTIGAGSDCPWDCEDEPDGAVGIDDLVAVINHWGPCPAPPAACPWDCEAEPDGAVGIDDLVAVINHWGVCP